MSTTMYERALGTRYAELPEAVQRFHRLTGYAVLDGWVETHAPSSLLARVLARCLGAPTRADRGPLRFELHTDPQGETWTRHFPSRIMVSRMRLVGGQVQEKLGLVRLAFHFVVTNGSLTMELVSLRFLSIPCPRWLLPRVVAEETGGANRLHFRVAATLPLVGTVASYHGHIDVPSKQESA